MNIYDALRKDHAKVQQLLNDLVKENQDIKVYKKLVSQIAEDLIPHARAEEAVFYNSIRDLEAGKGLVREAYGEHLAAETLLRTLQGLQVFGAEGFAIAKKLKDALEHHISDEEGKVFPAAQKLFLDHEADELGTAFEKMKSEIKEQTVVGQTWDMVVNLMPQRLRTSFQKFKPVEGTRS